MTTSYRNIVEAPRWADVSSAVKDAAFSRGLKLDIDVDKGWIRETVRFEVSGDASMVEDFKRNLLASLAEYNERLERS